MAFYKTAVVYAVTEHATVGPFLDQRVSGYFFIFLIRHIFDCRMSITSGHNHGCPLHTLQEPESHGQYTGKQKSCQGDCENGNTVSPFVGKKTTPGEAFCHYSVVVLKHCLTPLRHDPAVFNADDPVGQLGNLVVMRDHDDGLMKLLTRHFEESQHFLAGLAV